MPGIPFFSTVPGLRITIAVWSALLVADAVLFVADPADWRKHALLLAAPAFGLITTSFRLRSTSRALREAHRAESAVTR